LPINGFNVGNDYFFAVYDGNTGSLVSFDDIENVKIEARKHDIEVRPYNSDPLFGFVPDGYTLEFDVIRTDSDIEDAAVNYNALFDAATVWQPGTFNETIKNPDGTQSAYQYTNFVWFLTNHGEIKREKEVKLHIQGKASNKVPLAISA
jgi:hypothetical protein